MWVRDNVYVAYSHMQAGDPATAAAVANALLSFYRKYGHRLEPQAATAAQAGPGCGRISVSTVRGSKSLPTRRGRTRRTTPWGTASGCRRGWRGSGPCPSHCGTSRSTQALAEYFADIRYWDDEDSGHWEETKKRSASSIGVVVAALQEWVWLLAQHGALTILVSRTSLMEQASASLARGREALDAILPDECTQPDASQRRRYDAALLFLLYPLDVVKGVMADRIADDVRSHLQGEIGIRRYSGDSYWAPDYDTRLREEAWTRDYSNDVESRNRLLDRIGDEAQWCLFDPVLSAWYGQRYQRTGDAADLAAQTRHFNRSLAHITPDWGCPELYYLKGGVFTANPHTPLLWTQANLQLALTMLRTTAEQAF